MILQIHNIPLLHAVPASSSILSVPTTPFTPSFSTASTTASATRSAFKGFSTAAPANGVSLPPSNPLIAFPAKPPNAITRVNVLELSYRKPGRKKMLRSWGKEEAMVDSASRFALMYREGRSGAPAAAEMKTKEGTEREEAVRARVIA